MSLRASWSKTALAAGLLAGLLAAALGSYYLFERRQAPSAAPPASPAAGGAPGISSVPAAPATAGASRSKEQAALALMALPELKAWSASIERQSAGAAHGALIEYEPGQRIVNGKAYWQFSFVENSAETAQRWESFLVASGSDEILVEDTASDTLLSLERWRREKHPLQRGGD